MLEIKIEDFTNDTIAKLKDKNSVLAGIIRKSAELDTKIVQYIDLNDSTTLNRLMTEALVSDIRLIKISYRNCMEEKEIVALERLEELCTTTLSVPFQRLVFYFWSTS